MQDGTLTGVSSFHHLLPGYIRTFIGQDVKASLWRKRNRIIARSGLIRQRSDRRCERLLGPFRVFYFFGAIGQSKRKNGGVKMALDRGVGGDKVTRINAKKRSDPPV